MTYATILTFAIGTVIAFTLGSYVGKIGHENVYKEGAKYAIIAVVGTLVSHLIADCIQLLI